MPLSATITGYCMKCDKIQQPPYSGPVLCTVDGISLSDHVKVSGCPLNKFQAEYANMPPDSRAIPRDEWPVWAKALALVSTDADKGIGDTVARAIGPKCSAAFKSWHMTVFGKSCGCKARQSEWNQLYPYSTSPSAP